MAREDVIPASEEMTEGQATDPGLVDKLEDHLLQILDGFLAEIA
jgi:hypothetical protein